MQELQSKIEVYEQKNKKIEDAISSINTEILKLEKKKSFLKDEIDKHILDIKIITMKDINNKFNTKD